MVVKGHKAKVVGQSIMEIADPKPELSTNVWDTGPSVYRGKRVAPPPQPQPEPEPEPDDMGIKEVRRHLGAIEASIGAIRAVLSERFKE